MKHFKHIHSSGRFDRSGESLSHAARVYQTEADLITYTEVDFPERKKALRNTGKVAFETLLGDQGHADDCAIQYNKARFTLQYHESFQNSTKVVYRTDGHVRDFPHSRIAVLRDLITNDVLIVCVSHYASHVEGEVRDRNTTFGRVIQWRQSTRRSKNRVNQLAKIHKANGRLLIGDWNVNFKRLWVRSMIKAFAPAFRSTWRNLRFAGGTHGPRVIDATLLRGAIKVRNSAELHKDDPSSDHRPYIETLIWQ